MPKLRLKVSKRVFTLGIAVVVTLANAGGLAMVVLQYNRRPSAQAVVQDIVKPKIEVANAEKRDIDETLRGEKIGTGSYKSETLAKSKITSGRTAKLVIAAHEPTGGHFVLAFLSSAEIPGADKLEPGWNLQTIANDPMWAPGACSSKPSFLVKNKYIFIDDGKVDPDDLYSSYVMFDMHTGQYRYFGGNNFTETQGKKESILLAVNEDDKVVFYIDPVDDEPFFEYNGAAPGHTRGRDKAYVIRREIDPDTLDYTDYSLPFRVPEDMSNYRVYAYTSKNNVQFTFSSPYNQAPGPSYEGRLESNSIKLALPGTQAFDNSVYAPLPPDSELELQLDGMLRTTLSNLAKQSPPGQGVHSQTLFNAYELGSFQGIRFLDITQRNGQPGSDPSYVQYFSTPLVYDSHVKQVYPMVTTALLRNYNDYVNLGAF